jgi:putative ABC transport system permease protein
VLQQQPDGASWNTGGDNGAVAPKLGAAEVAALLGPGTRLIPTPRRG